MPIDIVHALSTTTLLSAELVLYGLLHIAVRDVGLDFLGLDYASLGMLGWFDMFILRNAFLAIEHILVIVMTILELVTRAVINIVFAIPTIVGFAIMTVNTIFSVARAIMITAHTCALLASGVPPDTCLQDIGTSLNILPNINMENTNVQNINIEDANVQDTNVQDADDVQDTSMQRVQEVNSTKITTATSPSFMPDHSPRPFSPPSLGPNPWAAHWVCSPPPYS